MGLFNLLSLDNLLSQIYEQSELVKWCQHHHPLCEEVRKSSPGPSEISQHALGVMMSLSCLVYSHSHTEAGPHLGDHNNHQHKDPLLPAHPTQCHTHTHTHTHKRPNSTLPNTLTHSQLARRTAKSSHTCSQCSHTQAYIPMAKW